MRPSSECGAGLFRRLAVPMVVDRYPGSVPCELLGDDPANPAGGAGDKNDTVGKVHGVPSFACGVIGLYFLLP
jgi:hypothetical protein